MPPNFKANILFAGICCHSVCYHMLRCEILSESAQCGHIHICQLSQVRHHLGNEFTFFKTPFKRTGNSRSSLVHTQFFVRDSTDAMFPSAINGKSQRPSETFTQSPAPVPFLLHERFSRFRTKGTKMHRDVCSTSTHTQLNNLKHV